MTLLNAIDTFLNDCLYKWSWQFVTSQTAKSQTRDFFCSELIVAVGLYKWLNCMDGYASKLHLLYMLHIVWEQFWHFKFITTVLLNIKEGRHVGLYGCVCWKSSVSLNLALRVATLVVGQYESWCVTLHTSWRRTVCSLSLIHIWRCRRSTLCRSRWSPYH